MLEYKRVITDLEQQMLEHDLLDITAWIDAAIAGKIANCAKRMAVAHREELVASGAKLVPASIDDLCASALDSDTYLNRVERENALNGQAQVDSGS